MERQPLSRIKSFDDETLARALKILESGGLVAFPTETVYGLGASALNDDALKKLFAAKGRPADHPVIVHLASAEGLKNWVQDVPAEAKLLADTFWPGPLTLILKRSEIVSDLVTGGQATVGLRVPNHPVALALLEAFGAIAAPSANRFGRISPTRAVHVAAELGERVDLILDGGEAQVGLESTIVDLSTGRARVLRPGGVSVAALAEVLGYAPEFIVKAEIRASGMLDSHYAPMTASFLVDSQQLDKLARTEGKRTGFLSLRLKPAWVKGRWLTLGPHPEDYAHNLYAALRDLDNAGLDRIYVEAVPERPEWLAVRDRLQRATVPKLEPEAVPKES